MGLRWLLACLLVAAASGGFAAGEKASERGRQYFTGERSFASGAPACMACHTAGDRGVLGGGSLGLDKSGLHARLGDAGIEAVLANPAFPVMREAFKGKSLSAGERADLAAFFKSAGSEPVRPAWLYAGRLVTVGAYGALVLFGFVYLRVGRARLSPRERYRRAP